MARTLALLAALIMAACDRLADRTAESTAAVQAAPNDTIPSRFVRTLVGAIGGHPPHLAPSGPAARLAP